MYLRFILNMKRVQGWDHLVASYFDVGNYISENSLLKFYFVREVKKVKKTVLTDLPLMRQKASDRKNWREKGLFDSEYQRNFTASW